MEAEAPRAAGSSVALLPNNPEGNQSQPPEPPEPPFLGMELAPRPPDTPPSPPAVKAWLREAPLAPRSIGEAREEQGGGAADRRRAARELPEVGLPEEGRGAGQPFGTLSVPKP